MIRDVNFYKFLKDAIVNKYRNANVLDFRTISYDPWIYKWARDTFRELKTPEFLNIQNRDVLKRLYERLHIDPRLKPLDDPDLALGNKDYELSENFHQQHEADRLLAQQKVTAASGPAPGGESATTMASKGGPSTPSPYPPVIHNIPQIGPTGISQNLSKPPVPEEGPDTAKARRLNEAKAITEKGAAAAKPELRFKPGFTNTFKNFGSAAGRFFKTNSGRIAGGLSEMAKGLGRGIVGPGLTGASNFLGKAGVGGINAFASLSNQISGPRFLTGGASKRIAWVFLGMFLLFAIGASVIGGLVGTTPSGETGGNVGIGTATPSAGVQPSPGPIPTAKLAQILHWAGIVNNALEQPFPPDGSWDRMQANISNNGYNVIKQPGAPGSKYWCTYLVADSYNLAGMRGLSINSHGLVRNMLSFWQNTPGYFYIPKGISALQSAKPGYAVFRINPGGYELDHVSILSYIDVDARGNGEIRTLDSNTYNHWESRIINGVETDRSFFAPIVGFGGITE